jgi:hypothetical protein
MTTRYRFVVPALVALATAVAALFSLDHVAVAGAVLAGIPGLPVLTRDMLASRRVGIPGQADVIWSPLFDYQQYPAAGAQNFTFFSQQQGTGVTSAPAGGTGPKTAADTNLKTSSQLGKGNDFFGIRMEALFYPGVTNSTSTPFGLFLGRGNVALANIGQFVNDIWAVGNGGVLTLQVGTDRPYITSDGPLMIFPPITRIALAASNSNTFDSDSTATAVVEEISYAAWSGTPYNMVGLFIENLQTFSAVVNFPAAIATPSTIAGRIGLRFGGYLARQVT